MLAQLSSGRKVFLLPLLAISFSVASCSSPSNSASTSTQGTASSAGASASPASSTARVAQGGGTVSLTGAGATFPAPLYQRWFSEYNKQHPNVQVSYQAVGSGAGVQQFTQGTVDFGASDVAMTDAEIVKVQRGVVLLPMTAGAIVVAYNLPNVKSGLKLSRQVYPAIFQGQIKTWNDPKIAQANPGVNLPNLPITIVHRSDGSGTTSVFTSHLSAISSQWKSQVGSGKTVNWPVGVGAKGNDGVTAQIQQTQGAIGYVEYGYATQNNVPFASLQNKSGKYAEATAQTASDTLNAVKLPSNLRAFITDPTGANSYPIVTYTWLLAYKTYPDATKAKALKDVINYGLTQGQQSSSQLGYVPLPSKVVQQVQAAANSIGGS